MKKRELIEKLEDLATYFTLAASDAEERKKIAEIKVDFQGASLAAGRKVAYNNAFQKLHRIIKEVKA